MLIEVNESRGAGAWADLSPLIASLPNPTPRLGGSGRSLMVPYLSSRIA